MKKEDITKLSLEELTGRVNSSVEQLAKTKLAHAVSPIENAVQIRTLRRNIARLKTELTKRETQK
ncbi:MAG: 50S ribosomal protein L29 [Flavobacteriia bacterium]|nr:50S ribosomal protein L29 [Flavobacteriia bacterium]OJX37450.1 MAG: 50S ribosomal protein L29 [Flavobacteriia bacterium 40-80]